MNKEIHKQLGCLGITANYSGFHHVACAVMLAVQEPKQLLFITKTLYTSVAQRYGTKWSCVERNIRTVVALAWNDRREYLETLAGYPLKQKPTASQFIAILVAHIQNNGN